MITLRDARKNMGYTQAQLAEIVGITVYERNGQFYSSAYCLIENGKVMMSAALYLKLCEVLHVQPGVLEPPSPKLNSNFMGGHKRKRPAQPAGR